MAMNNIRYWIKKLEYSTVNQNELKYRFNEFEHKIWCDKIKYEKNITRANDLIAYAPRLSDIVQEYEPIVRLSRELQHNLREEFFNTYIEENMCVLVQIPPANESPAGNSLYTNWLEGLRYIGIKAEPIYFADDTKTVFERINPDVILSCNEEQYLSKLDWEYIKRYRSRHDLVVGLSVSLSDDAVEKAINLGTDFCFTYDDLKYTKNIYEGIARKIPLLSVPFSVNPMIYYPLPGVEKTLEFIFLASVNMDKWNRYIDYLSNIVQRGNSMLLGPGWRHYKINDINPHRDRALYAMSKVGLNLHLDFQIASKNHLNERTYQLAACGVPQVIDNPALLNEHFEGKCFFVSKSPEEYEHNFKYALEDRDEAIKRAMKAMKEVYKKHTVFQRMKKLIDDINLIKTGKYRFI